MSECRECHGTAEHFSARLVVLPRPEKKPRFPSCVHSFCAANTQRTEALSAFIFLRACLACSPWTDCYHLKHTELLMRAGTPSSLSFPLLSQGF